MLRRKRYAAIASSPLITTTRPLTPSNAVAQSLGAVESAAEVALDTSTTNASHAVALRGGSCKAILEQPTAPSLPTRGITEDVVTGSLRDGRFALHAEADVFADGDGDGEGGGSTIKVIDWPAAEDGGDASTYSAQKSQARHLQ